MADSDVYIEIPLINQPAIIKRDISQNLIFFDSVSEIYRCKAKTSQTIMTIIKKKFVRYFKISATTLYSALDPVIYFILPLPFRTLPIA